MCDEMKEAKSPILPLSFHHTLCTTGPFAYGAICFCLHLIWSQAPTGSADPSAPMSSVPQKIPPQSQAQTGSAGSLACHTSSIASEAVWNKPLREAPVLARIVVTKKALFLSPIGLVAHVERCKYRSSRSLVIRASASTVLTKSSYCSVISKFLLEAQHFVPSARPLCVSC